MKKSIEIVLNQRCPPCHVFLCPSFFKMASNLNDILDLSKVESGKLELELIRVSLSSLLKGSLAMVKERALKHSIKLSCDIAQRRDDLWARLRWLDTDS